MRLTTRVRPYTAADAKSVVDVILPIQRSEFGIPIALEDQPDLADIAVFYQHGKGGFWVAERNGVVVGTIALLDIGERQAALRKMFVARTHRGPEFGVATQLLATLLEHCRIADVAEIYLGTTAAFVAAHRFYEKHGFTQIAKQALPRSFPVMSVDTRFYHRSLR